MSVGGLVWYHTEEILPPLADCGVVGEKLSWTVPARRLGSVDNVVVRGTRNAGVDTSGRGVVAMR